MDRQRQLIRLAVVRRASSSFLGSAETFAVMAGGGQACNVNWWVAQAATLTTSSFQGTILAGADITVTGGNDERGGTPGNRGRKGGNGK